MSDRPLDDHDASVPSPGPDTLAVSAADTPRSAHPLAMTYGYGSEVAGAEEVHLSDYLRVLYKRRWVALTAFLVVFVGVCIYVVTATPIYEARVQILIEKEASNVVTFKEAVEQNQITDDYYQTQYRILQSRALARRTIDALKLWNHPQFDGRVESPGTMRRLAAAPLAILSTWRRSTVRVDQPLPDETKAESRAIDRFLVGLTVSPIRNSRLVDVRFDSPDPALAANVANGLARAYIEQNLEFKFLSSKEASDWLAERLAEQRKQVESSEQALQRYREQTDSVSLEERQNIVVQKLADLNAAVTRAKTERIQKEAAYNQMLELQNDRAALDTFPAILSNTFIQQQKGELADLQRQQAQLSEKLGPRHPDMLKIGLAIQTAEAKIHGEIGKVVQAVHNDYQQALAQEQSLTVALDQQKRDALDLNRKGIDYGALSRDAATNRQIFEGLLQRTKETGISGELRISNIRVVDPAEVPRSPATPDARTDFLVALFGGSVLAVGLAFFFEYFDNRIKSPEEMKRHLGLPFLGMIPALFDAKTKAPLINDGVSPSFSESFRAVRTNVLFSSAEEGGRSLVITSTIPGEGKTLVASNVAVGLAQVGARVLLIDADLRKSRLHTIFSKPQHPGLSDVLIGAVEPSGAVHATDVPRLWLLPAGTSSPNPVELLGSPRFKGFLATLTRHFDWVVIDTPPIMAVTDSAVVAHLVTGVLFVVGAEMTSRHAAQRALEQLEHGHAKFIGAVLNRVDLQHHGYYYSHYYKRKYKDYYKSAGTPVRSTRSIFRSL
jgi:polysaccharide biosynthesis transport protein